VILADVRRQHAMDLVLGGRERLPISSVARLRRQLVGRQRVAVAELLARMLQEADVRSGRAVHPTAIVELRDEVTEIVELLRCTLSAQRSRYQPPSCCRSPRSYSEPP
jgi:hypothetical protein